MYEDINFEELMAQELAFQESKANQYEQARLEEITSVMEAITGQPVYNYKGFKKSLMLGIMNTLSIHVLRRKELATAVGINMALVEGFRYNFGQSAYFSQTTGELFQEVPMKDLEKAKSYIKLAMFSLELMVTDEDLSDITFEAMKAIREEDRATAQNKHEKYLLGQQLLETMAV